MKYKITLDKKRKKKERKEKIRNWYHLRVWEIKWYMYFVAIN